MHESPRGGHNTSMKPAIQHVLARVTRHGPIGETDALLLSRFVRDRDGDAFAAILDLHGRLVWGVCRGLLLNEADAEDAFQATFVALFRGAAKIRQRDSLAPWLHATATRIARKTRLTAARRTRRESRAAKPESAPAASSDETWESLNFALHEEIVRLPELLRVAFVLCVLEGKRHEDAAAQLGVPVGTLSARVSRARKRVLDRLSSRGMTPAIAVAFGAASATAAVPGPFVMLLRHHLADGFVAVPMSVRTLAAAAAGGSSMTMKRLTSALVVGVLSAGIGGTWLANAQQKPKVLPGSEPAPGGTPRPVAKAPADEPAWRAEFDKIYKLKDGEVLKRVAEFPECRAEYIRTSPRLSPGTDAAPINMALRVHQKETKGELHLWGFGGGDATIFSVMWQIGIPMGEVEADKKLLDTPIGGDFVFRQEAPVEQLVAALERVLREECKLAVKLTFKEVEREVVVASGTLKIVPLEGQQKNHVEVFGKEIGKGEAWGSRKDLHGFLLDLGGFLGRRVVNEAKSGKDEVFTYGLSVRQNPRQRLASELDIPSPPDTVPLPKFDPAIEAEDRDPKLVLPNVAKQTGLTYATEQRKVRVLFVEKGER
jgi:RNA polymerase sigma factor (sigma-70 family)